MNIPSNFYNWPTACVKSNFDWPYKFKKEKKREGGKEKKWWRYVMNKFVSFLITWTQNADANFQITKKNPSPLDRKGRWIFLTGSKIWGQGFLHLLMN